MRSEDGRQKSEVEKIRSCCVSRRLRKRAGKLSWVVDTVFPFFPYGRKGGLLLIVSDTSLSNPFHPSLAPSGVQIVRGSWTRS